MTDTETEVQWNPDGVVEGTTIWVTEYFRTGSDPVPAVSEIGYDVRVTEGTKDSDGDIRLTNDRISPRNYAHKWRLPVTAGLPVEEQRPPSGVIWNPEVKKGDTIWVYRDSAPEYLQPDMHRGFDVRTVQYEVKDSDGEITVDPDQNSIYIYARKWRHPEQNLRPVVNPGDRIKVLGCLDGATEEYRNGVMGKVLIVRTGSRWEFDYPITVTLPDGMKVDNFGSGSISEWAIIEGNPVDTGKSEEAPTEEAPTEGAKDWASIIERWRHELTEFACSEGWCSEYEDVVRDKFGWEPQRGGDFDVNVRLTREKYLSDLVNNVCYHVFDGVRDEDRWDLDEEYITVRANITLTITCTGKEPTDDEVKEYLDQNDFEFDEFEIVDWERIEN